MSKEKCLNCLFVEKENGDIVGCVMEHTYYFERCGHCPDYRLDEDDDMDDGARCQMTPIDHSDDGYEGSGEPVEEQRLSVFPRVSYQPEWVNKYSMARARLPMDANMYGNEDLMETMVRMYCGLKG